MATQQPTTNNKNNIDVLGFGGRKGSSKGNGQNKQQEESGWGERKDGCTVEGSREFLCMCGANLAYQIHDEGGEEVKGIGQNV